MAGQSDPNASAFSAAELEFLAEDEMIEIVPNMRLEPLNLICITFFSPFVVTLDDLILWSGSAHKYQAGDFGPFRPQIATHVPLWLAVALKKRGKCTIRPPEWMSVEKLTQVLEGERDSTSEFQTLPYHYVEISRLLFDHAREDIPDVYMVRSLIEDIKDVRFHKISTGLEKINERTLAVKLNFSAMEVNVIRPFVTGSLHTFYKLDDPEMIPESDRKENRRPQAANRGPRRDLRR